MNRIYRLIWSELVNAWLVVAESIKSRGKKARLSTQLALLFGLSFLTTTFAFAAGPPATNALPQNGVVTTGQVNFSQNGTPSSPTLNVNQATQRAIVNWQSFNVGSQSTVNFNQPNANASILNRVVGTDPSQIYGHIHATGEVILQNQLGIYFSPSASLDVGAIAATTHQISDQNYLKGNYQFDRNNSNASIINEGNITTHNGLESYVALLAPEVRNTGLIVAQMGTVVMASGESIRLNFDGGSHLTSISTTPTLIKTLIENRSAVEAEGGLIILSSKAMNELHAGVIKQNGILDVSANKVVNNGGRILLLGDEVNVASNSKTLAESKIKDGHGGFIETSGHKVKIEDNAVISTAAPLGKNGEWLLDPVNFLVAATGGDITGAELSTLLNSNNVTLQTNTGTNTSTNLYGVSGTDGNITVNDSVTWSAHNLTLSAANSIYINSPLYGSGTASLSLLYGQGSADGGSNNYFLNAPVNLPTGNNFFTQKGTSGSLITYQVINDLNALQAITSTGNFALGSNIDASATSSWNSGAGFAPITNFSGNFEGLSHTISDLYINRPTSGYIGLFGNIYPSGSVSNVYLNNVDITGQYFVGALMGRNDPYDDTKPIAIWNVHASGSVTAIGGTTWDLFAYDHNAARVSFLNSSAGGLFGSIVDGKIFNSSSSVSVSGFSTIGGLAGYTNNTQINNSYSTGYLISLGDNNFDIGGLVGYADRSSSINNSYSLSTITSSSNDVGGLVGSLSVGGSIQSSYAGGNIVGLDWVGGLVGYKVADASVIDSFWNTETSGQSSSAGGVGLTSSQLRTPSQLTGFNFTTSPGASGNNWVMVNADGSLATNGQASASGSYPMLASEYSTSIRNAHQLQLMAMDPTANYTLANNIDASKTGTTQDIWNASFIPIQNYSGNFDGLSHTIYDLTINQPNNDKVGLFGSTLSDPVSIQNINLNFANIIGHDFVGTLVGLNDHAVILNVSSANGSVLGHYEVGGLVGRNTAGTLKFSGSSCNVTGDMLVGGVVGLNGGAAERISSNGSPIITGHSLVGGVAGMNTDSGTLLEPFSFSSIVSGDNYYIGGVVGSNLGIITYGITNDGTQIIGSSDYVGGFAGINYGAISNVVVGASSVLGRNYVGGLVGINYGTISGATNYASVLGSNYVGGSVGLNQATILSNNVTGNVYGTYAVGGIAGGSHGLIVDSTASGNVTGQGHSEDCGLNWSCNLGGLVGINYADGSISSSNHNPEYYITVATGAIISDTNGENSGGIAGINYGSISYVSATGNVNQIWNAGGLVGWNAGGSILNSIASGNISGTYSIGGLVGVANGSSSITESAATGNVHGTDIVGGLIGLINDDSRVGSPDIHITYSSSSGDVSGQDFIGGFVGKIVAKTTIDTSVSSSHISATNKAGGFIGWMENNLGEITNSSASGDVVTTGSFVGGFVGFNYNSNDTTWGSILNSYASGSVSGVHDVGGFVGLNSGYLKNVHALGSVAASDDDVGGLAGYNDGVIESSYALNNSISGHNNVGGLVGWNSTFNLSHAGDSRGQIIDSHSSSSVSGNINVGGLVGLLSDSFVPDIATITLSYAEGSVSGYQFVGGLVGEARANTLINNSYASNTVSANHEVGGLVGNNYGSIQLSYATGDVSASEGNGGGLVGANQDGGYISESFATGNVSGSGHTMGGLVGVNNQGSVLDNVYATGNVSGGSYGEIGGLVGYAYSSSSITNAYSLGFISGPQAGGLVGAGNPIITNSFWNIDTSGQLSSAGGDSLNNVQMKQAASFSAWDSNKWIIYEGYTSPLLKQFMTPLTVTTNALPNDVTYGDTINGNGVTYSATHSDTYSVDTPNLVFGDPIYVASNLNVGDRTLTASGLYSNQFGYAIDYTSTSLKINPATLTLTVDPNQSKIYGQADPSFTYTLSGFKYTDASNQELIGGALGREPGITVAGGPYRYTSGSLSAGSNYTIDFSQISESNLSAPKFTIQPAILIVTANNQRTTYGTSLDLGTSLFSVVNGASLNDTISNVIDALTLSQNGQTTIPVTQNAGTYQILGSSPIAHDGVELNNYSITYNPGLLTIDKKEVNITINNERRLYGDPNPANWTQTFDGFVNDQSYIPGGTNSAGITGDIGATTSPAQQSSSVGDYKISGSIGSLSAQNYSFKLNDGTMTIDPRPIVVSADNFSRLYGGENPNFTYSIGTDAGQGSNSRGMYGSDTLTGSLISTATYNTAVTTAGNEIPITQGTLNNSNYNITFNQGLLTINPAPLKIAAVNDARFVVESDETNFGGVIYTGFLNGETAATPGVIAQMGSVQRDFSVGTTASPSDPDASDPNAIGLHQGALVPNGFDAHNYAITYQNGDYSIVGTNTLLIKVAQTNTTYGLTPDYQNNVTARYLENINDPASIRSIPLIISGSSVSTNTLADTYNPLYDYDVSFNIEVSNPSNNQAGRLNTGGYQIAVNIANTSPALNQLTETPIGVGSLNVTPKIIGLSIDNLQKDSNGNVLISKIYDGNSNIDPEIISTLIDSNHPLIESGDFATLVASGNYSDKNVADNKDFNLSIALKGIDRNNYYLPDSNISNTGEFIGQITQLDQATYTGGLGGNWSNPNNWTAYKTSNGVPTAIVGAIPDYSNVRQVLIPTNSAVNFDQQNVGGLMTSQIINNGNLYLFADKNTTYAGITDGVTSVGNIFINNIVSGTGQVSIGGSGSVSLTNDNSFSGGTNIAANATLYAMSQYALGTGPVNSTNGNFGTLSDVTLPNLTINGPVNLLSGITTNNDQVYNGAVVVKTDTNKTNTLESLTGNIQFNGTLTSDATKISSLTSPSTLNIISNQGSVTFNDAVGQSIQTTGSALYNSNNIDTLNVKAQDIFINADILSLNSQTYNTPSGSGFANLWIGDNGSNGVVRYMVSVDPSVTVFGHINDISPSGIHTLKIYAISSPNLPAPNIYVTGDVGNVYALKDFQAWLAQNKSDPLPLSILNAIDSQTSAISQVNGTIYSYVPPTSNTNNISTFNAGTFLSLISQQLQARSLQQLTEGSSGEGTVEVSVICKQNPDGSNVDKDCK